MSSTSCFIITGPGRSGTHWVARMLSDLRLDVWHEGAFRPTTLKTWDTALAHPLSKQRTRNLVGSNGERPDGEVGWLSAPYLDLFAPSVSVVHLVRDPLDTVRSLSQRLFNPMREGFNEYTEAALKQMGDVTKVPDEIDLCLHYWWTWNRMIEARSNRRFQLEELTNGTNAWVELLDYLGHHRPLDQIQTSLNAPLERNAGRESNKPTVQWTDFQLPWVAEVQAMAERYGYGG